MPEGLDRRGFLGTIGAGVAASGLSLLNVPFLPGAPAPTSAPETAVKALYDSLTEAQRKTVCFEWDHQDGQRGLLRTHVSNNWHITQPQIASDFYTETQRGIVLEIFKGIFNPEWHARILKQLRDDSGGEQFGNQLNFAIFGKPGEEKFEFVMTGRHLTIRADGNTEKHVALGGPIFHGHAASGFNEKKGHPGNVFWHQALEANKVFKLLDGKQQEKALAPRLPRESAVNFRAADQIPGLPGSEMTRDQKEALEKVLLSLIEPYRKEDQEEVQSALKAQGGLDKCRLTFYQQGDLGDDGEWDNWRIEGPAFVWYFRGTPHVHIWVNVADDPSPKLNARG
jgi:hypothetical protein